MESKQEVRPEMGKDIHVVDDKKVPKIQVPDPNLKYFNPLAAGEYRNNPCVCGSGKKIKKCHGKERKVSLDERREIVRMVNEFNIKFQTEFAKQAEQAIKEENERKERAEDIRQQISGESEKTT